MQTIRKADDRGHMDHGWLDTQHTFSFGQYHDPAHMGFRSLRVINEDRVAAGAGFGKHPHRDMEIVTYVLDGVLAHEDSTGNAGLIHPGELQRMTAGTGIIHSEMNGSADEPVHFLQIWIEPEERGLEPGYEQRAFDLERARGAWLTLASRDGQGGSLTVHQDAALHVTRLGAGDALDYALDADRHAWIQVARGAVRVGDHELRAGDGLAVSSETAVRLQGVEEAEVLLFDLA
ncbi:MAG: pirin family protein [Planctomycetota bacterium]|nr:pirin family protein [Planctomycetota bacterium]